MGVGRMVRTPDSVFKSERFWGEIEREACGSLVLSKLNIDLVKIKP